MKGLFSGDGALNSIVRILGLIGVPCVFLLLAAIIALQLHPAESDSNARVSQVITSVFTFVVPSLFLSFLYSKKPLSFLCLKPAHWRIIVLSAISMFVVFPFSSFLEGIFEEIQFPSVFNEMLELEEKSNDMINRLIFTDRFEIFLFNVLVFALVPAVGEELFFRGVFFETIRGRIKNIHVCVWLTALCFALAHFYVRKMIPIFLIGAYLGYLRVWGNSLYVSIAAHFTNNFIIVLIGYCFEETIVETDIPYLSLMAIVSLAFFSFVAYKIYQNHSKKSIKEYIPDKKYDDSNGCIEENVD